MNAGTVHLTPASVEALAVRVAEMLREQPSTGELVDAAELARRFSLSRDTIYSRADEFGAIRIGDGPRARLRFDPAIVADRLAARPHPLTDPISQRPRSRRRRGTPDANLLPILGGEAR